MLTDRFDDALAFAARLHRQQRRKGADTPYIAHLLSVAALVLEHGGDEDQAIAGLLHDAVEDQGGMEMAEDISRRFGDRVARTVLDCSDSADGQKAPWKTRKLDYLAGIAKKSDDATLVTACDKLHNATAIVEDLRAHGRVVFDRFTAGEDGTLWYYAELARALTARWPGPLSARLERRVAEMQSLAARLAAPRDLQSI